MVGFCVDAAAHASGQAFGLFEDFLQHEMRISALLNLSKVDVNRLDFKIQLVVVHVHDLQLFTSAHHGNISIVKIHNLVGVFHDRAGIGTQEELVFTDSHHQRALLSGSDNLVRVALVENGNGISANHLMQSQLDRRQQVKILLQHDVFH